MGSSGGYFSGKVDPEKLRRRVREAEDKARGDDFDAEVGRLIGEKLAEFNDRDVDGINIILDNVKTELSDEVEGTVELLYGGSVAKHTYIDGLSDIDALVLLAQKEAEDSTPGTLRSLFAEKLRSRFGRENVTEGDLAVTLNIDDKSIQLLRAVSIRMRQISHFVKLLSFPPSVC